MLTTGIFLDKLKIAKVIPWLKIKKDEETLFTNYRPISLLLASYFQIRSYSFLEKKLLYNAQYGLRTEYSTELAALELIDRVIVEIDKTNTPTNIFLDLSTKYLTLLIIKYC